MLPIDEAVQQTSGKAPKIQMSEECHKAIKLQHATHIIADFGNTTYLSRNASVPRRARLPSIHCHHRHWKTQLNPQLPMYMEYIYICVIGSSFNCPGRRTCHSFEYDGLIFDAGGRKLLVHGSLALAVAPVLIAFTSAMAHPP